MTIYIYSHQKAHGIKVIIDNLLRSFKNRGISCMVISTLKGRDKSDIIIPYSVKEANELIQSGLSTKIAFCADAVTLGFRNKIKHYLKVGNVFNYDFFYSIYAYLKYIPLEKKMLQSYAKCILVSPSDIGYMERVYKVPISKFIYAPNGVEKQAEIQRTRSEVFRIGILSPWVSKPITEESKWFINKYFRKYSKTHNNIELILAGRGARIRQFEGMKNVKVLGEVASLEDFFSNIDVMISANPKGCGILNRILDSFSYRVPVCGVPGSFSGFPNSEGCYLKFSTYREFCEIIEEIMKRRDQLSTVADNAYSYIQEHHNWDQIYEGLVNDIIKEIEK